MAESTLSITYSQLQREVGRFAGWDRNPANWTTDQITDFGDILNAGLRMFYYPPSPTPDRPQYQWSFLTPQVSIAVSTMATTLSDDFSGVIIDDSVTFNTAVSEKKLQKVKESDIRALLSQGATPTGPPQCFAIRARAMDATLGLRWEIVVYPVPTSSTTLLYRYCVAPNTLDATNIYPYGGAIHSETIKEAVLAAAEKIIDDDGKGAHADQFQQLLARSIAVDQEIKNSMAPVASA